MGDKIPGGYPILWFSPFSLSGLWIPFPDHLGRLDQPDSPCVNIELGPPWQSPPALPAPHHHHHFRSVCKGSCCLPDSCNNPGARRADASTQRESLQWVCGRPRPPNLTWPSTVASTVAQSKSSQPLQPQTSICRMQDEGAPDILSKCTRDASWDNSKQSLRSHTSLAWWF